MVPASGGREAWIELNVGDAAERGLQNGLLRSAETVTSIVPRFSGTVEPQPPAELACSSPREDEAIDVWVAPLPTERWCCVRSRNRNVELQDPAVVGCRVHVPQRGHSVGGDERAVVAACDLDDADQGVLPWPGREGKGATLLRGV